jgi:hypothetical protein
MSISCFGAWKRGAISRILSNAQLLSENFLKPIFRCSAEGMDKQRVEY